MYVVQLQTYEHGTSKYVLYRCVGTKRTMCDAVQVSLALQVVDHTDATRMTVQVREISTVGRSLQRQQLKYLLRACTGIWKSAVFEVRCSSVS